MLACHALGAATPVTCLARPAAGSTSGQSASHTGTSGNQERGPRPGTPPSGSALGPAHREYGCGCGGRSALSNVRGGSCVVVRMVVMGNSRSSRGHRPRRRVLGFAAARQIWHQNDWPRSRCSSPLPPPLLFPFPFRGCFQSNGVGGDVCAGGQLDGACDAADVYIGAGVYGFAPPFPKISSAPLALFHCDAKHQEWPSHCLPTSTNQY